MRKNTNALLSEGNS